MYKKNYHQEKDAQREVISQLRDISNYEIYGKVYGISGGVVLVSGLKGLVTLGGVCHIETDNGERIYGEVIGFEDDMTKILFACRIGMIRSGLRVYAAKDDAIYPCESWLGHTLNAFCHIQKDGKFIDMPRGDMAYALKNMPPLASQRRGFGKRLETQSNIFNTFLPICEGQRIGLFAGSGVGKSTLMSHFAKFIEADIIIIGLIGERGREVNDFIRKTLNENLQKKCIIVAVSSDEPALLKKRGAYLSLTLAEYFRDQGKNVVLLLDSLTRLAEAQREMGLMAGEPPAMRAFPPSCFTEIMGLCERAGPGREDSNDGSITAFFTVLVQGSDMEEPVADCVRGTLDGHVVMDRDIAERGLYPAIDVLKSVSRSLPDCATEEENLTLKKSRRLLSLYKEVEPMVKLGVYKKGLSKETDNAVDIYPDMEEFLYASDLTPTEQSFSYLEAILKTEL
ncbi:MAG: FliI/YscN family ATPase [Pseudomonadota bacterium]